MKRNLRLEIDQTEITSGSWTFHYQRTITESNRPCTTALFESFPNVSPYLNRMEVIVQRFFHLLFITLILWAPCATGISGELLSIVDPEEVGLSGERLGRIDNLEKEYIAQKKLPNVITVVARHGIHRIWRTFLFVTILRMNNEKDYRWLWLNRKTI